MFCFAVELNLLNAILGEAWARNHYFIYLVGAADIAQRAVAPKHPQSMNNLSLLHWIVVHKPNRYVLQLSIIQYLAQKQFTAIPRPVNQHAAPGAAVGRRQKLPKEAKGHAAPC